MKKYLKGFTLIEVLIVIAIIGIIAAVAYPSYQKSIKKTKRTECKAKLLQVVSAIEKQKIAYKRYTAIPATKIGLDATGIGYCGGTSQANADYTIRLTSVANGNINQVNWELEATPGNNMAGTGNLKINQQGQKCWKRNNSSCTLSASSTWDE